MTKFPAKSMLSLSFFLICMFLSAASCFANPPARIVVVPQSDDVLAAQSLGFHVLHTRDYRVLYVAQYALNQYRIRGRELNEMELLGELMNVDRAAEMERIRSQSSHSWSSNLFSQEGKNFLGGLRTIYTGALSGNLIQLGRGMVEIATGVFGGEYRRMTTPYEAQRSASNLLSPQDYFFEEAGSIFLELREAAKTSPALAFAIDQYAGNRLPHGILASPATIFDAPANAVFSSLPSTQRIRAAFDGDRIVATPDEVHVITRNFSAELGEIGRESAERLRRFTQEIRIQEDGTTPTSRAAVQAGDNRLLGTLSDYDRLQLRIDGSRAAINIISQFVGLGNPQAGQTILAIGNAHITMIQAMINYEKNMRMINTTEIFNNADMLTDKTISTVILTGDMVSAIFGLATALSGPSAEQLILQDTHEIKQMVAAVSEQLTGINAGLHDHLHYIDRTLESMMGVLTRNTLDLNRMLNHLSGQISEVHAQIESLRLSIDTQHQSVLAHLQLISIEDRAHFEELSRQIFSTTNSICTNRRETVADLNINAQVTQRCFDAYSNYLQLASTGNITNIPSQLLASPDLISPAGVTQLQTLLSEYGLYGSAGHLLKIARAWFMPLNQAAAGPLPRIVNLKTWAILSKEILEFALRSETFLHDLPRSLLWADGNTPQSTGVIVDLIRKAHDTRSEIGKLKGSFNGRTWVPNLDFWAVLISNYTSALNAVIRSNFSQNAQLNGTAMDNPPTGGLEGLARNFIALQPDSREGAGTWGFDLLAQSQLTTEENTFYASTNPGNPSARPAGVQAYPNGLRLPRVTFTSDDAPYPGREFLVGRPLFFQPPGRAQESAGSVVVGGGIPLNQFISIDALLGPFKKDLLRLGVLRISEAKIVAHLENTRVIRSCHSASTFHPNVYDYDPERRGLSRRLVSPAHLTWQSSITDHQLSRVVYRVVVRFDILASTDPRVLNDNSQREADTMIEISQDLPVSREFQTSHSCPFGGANPNHVAYSNDQTCHGQNDQELNRAELGCVSDEALRPFLRQETPQSPIFFSVSEPNDIFLQTLPLVREIPEFRTLSNTLGAASDDAWRHRYITKVATAFRAQHERMRSYMLSHINELTPQLERLSLMKRLVQNYVQLALPNTLITDDTLHALLGDAQGIPGGDDIRSYLSQNYYPTADGCSELAEIMGEHCLTSTGITTRATRLLDRIRLLITQYPGAELDLESENILNGLEAFQLFYGPNNTR